MYKVINIVNIIQKLEKVLSAPLSAEGYAIVRIQIYGLKRKNLQIMIEHLDEAPITVDDCAKASRLISVFLDVENLMNGSYVLEVSSSGVDRPLVKINDYVRFIGNIIAVKTIKAIEERKVFQGILSHADQNYILIKLEKPLVSGATEVQINYCDIRSANLYTDLLKG